MNKIKILAIVLVSICLIFTGLFYVASTKLNPEEIKKIVVAQTQKVFPRSKVTLEKVDIKFGLNFKIHLEKFKMSTEKNNKQIELASVDQLTIKVPIWAILTGAGIVEVKLDAPFMNYYEFEEGNNWVYSVGETKSISTDSKEESGDSKKSLGGLGFLTGSKINVKLSDIGVKYHLRDNSNGDIKISRFLINGLNFESATAFEIASDAKFIMKDKSQVSFNTVAIGQLNIADLLKNGSVSSLVIVKVNNFSKTGLELKIPEITTNIDVLLKKDGEMSGKLTTTFETQNKITANFKMSKTIEISDINIDIALKDVATILGLDSSIDMSKSKLTSKGSVVYGADKKINANISFSISPGIGYSKEGLTATTIIGGDFKEKDISVKAKTDVLGGNVNTLVSGEFNPNEKFEIEKLRPFDIKIAANGIKLPEKFIRAKLWDKKVTDEKNEENTKEILNEQAAPAASAGLPPSNIVLDWNNINVGGEDFSGHGKILTSLHSVAVDNLNFKFSKGTGKLTQTMNLGKKSSDSKFNFEINNLNLNSFKAFLPPFVENFSGVFTGKVNGSVTMFSSLNKAPSYDINVVADAKNGEIKKLNLSEYINPLLSNIPVVKDQVKGKEMKINGDFETFTMKGRFTTNQYTLSSFNFIGVSKKVEVQGSGEIYPVANSGKNSQMEVNYIDNTGKISEVLQKNVGTKILPMKLTGPGFELKPDYQFTISKLTKGAVKTKGAEVAKEVLQKQIEKVVPAAAKEKVQGLLNGLFKRK